jgi:hypothetical protein
MKGIRKTEKKTKQMKRKIPQETDRPKSRSGPQPIKPKPEAVPLFSLRSLTGGPYLSGDLIFFNLRPKLLRGDNRVRQFLPRLIPPIPGLILHHATTIKTAPIFSLAYNLSPSLSATRLPAKNLVVPQMSKPFIDGSVSTDHPESFLLLILSPFRLAH